jgi:hypothetical protein
MNICSFNFAILFIKNLKVLQLSKTPALYGTKGETCLESKEYQNNYKTILYYETI